MAVSSTTAERRGICPRFSSAFGTSSTPATTNWQSKVRVFFGFLTFSTHSKHPMLSSFFPPFQHSHSWNQSGRKFKPVDWRLVVYVSWFTPIATNNILQAFCFHFFGQVVEDKETSYLGKDRSVGQFAPGEDPMWFLQPRIWSGVDLLEAFFVGWKYLSSCYFDSDPPWSFLNQKKPTLKCEKWFFGFMWFFWHFETSPKKNGLTKRDFWKLQECWTELRWGLKDKVLMQSLNSNVNR